MKASKKWATQRHVVLDCQEVGSFYVVGYGDDVSIEFQSGKQRFHMEMTDKEARALAAQLISRTGMDVNNHVVRETE